MITSGMMSSNSNEWTTPQTLFDELNREFNFTLDPCATNENAKCKKYFTINEDGLIQDWDGIVLVKALMGGQKTWRN